MKLNLVLDIAPSRPPQSVREWAWGAEQPLPEVKSHPDARPQDCPVGDKPPTVRQSDIPKGSDDHKAR